MNAIIRTDYNQKAKIQPKKQKFENFEKVEINIRHSANTNPEPKYRRVMT